MYLQYRTNYFYTITIKCEDKKRHVDNQGLMMEEIVKEKWNIEKKEGKLGKETVNWALI